MRRLSIWSSHTTSLYRDGGVLSPMGILWERGGPALVLQLPSNSWVTGIGDYRSPFNDSNTASHSMIFTYLAHPSEPVSSGIYTL